MQVKEDDNGFAIVDIMERGAENAAGGQMVEIDGTKIRKIREEKELTQLYVATVVGVTTDTISRWENRKYPSIKRDNALKLAGALDVDLEAIIDQPVDQEIPEEEPRTRKPVPGWRKKIPGKKTSALIFLVLAGGLGLLFILKTAGQHEPVQVTARRIMPEHAPAGAIFPVLIKISVKESGPFSLIVKEYLPEGCRATEGVPRFNLTGKGGRELKWVSRVEDTADIAYLVENGKNPDPAELTGFKGEIVVGSKAASRDISGDSSVNPAPYHWVDEDRDNIIDDEEILAFYNLFSDVELDIGKDLIDEIWASKGYEWNEKNRQYEIMRNK